jgi:hypothetical protein
MSEWRRVVASVLLLFAMIFVAFAGEVNDWVRLLFFFVATTATRVAIDLTIAEVRRVGAAVS